MSDNKRYCPHCNEEHIVSPTFDNNGDIVGYFCNRAKLLVDVTNHDGIWDGSPVGFEIGEFTVKYIDVEALRKLNPSRLSALAKRIAYAFLQTDFAKERRINFAFVHYYALIFAKGIYYEVVYGKQAKGGR
jgi:hypothetical protein